jgi:hypothetical protein
MAHDGLLPADTAWPIMRKQLKVPSHKGTAVIQFRRTSPPMREGCPRQATQSHVRSFCSHSSIKTISSMSVPQLLICITMEVLDMICYHLMSIGNELKYMVLFLNLSNLLLQNKVERIEKLHSQPLMKDSSKS